VANEGPQKGGHTVELCAADDWLVHQSLDPISTLWTDDPRAYERYWFGIQDREGLVRITQGAGFYPNLGTSESFVIVVMGGRHTTIRVFKGFDGNRLSLEFPPIHADIVDGLRTWRLRLDGNQWGISYDLTWTDTKRPVYRRVGPSVDDGQLTKAMAGFETFGNCRGWVEAGGTRMDAAELALSGSRDRHWGVRDGVGGRAYVVGDRSRASLPPYFPGQWVEFKEFGLWGDVVLRNWDDPRPSVHVVDFERRLRFDPVTKLFRSGTVTNYLDDGQELVLRYERLGNQIAFLRCGGYGGPRGGTPDRDIWSGMYVGEEVVEGESYDANDADVQVALAGLDQHHCVVHCGEEMTQGLFEAYEPELYERCVAGEPTFAMES